MVLAVISIQGSIIIPHFYWEATGKLSDAPGNFLEIQNLPKPPKNSKITNVDIIIRLKEY